MWDVLASEAVFYDYAEDKVLRGRINYDSETSLFAVLADMNINHKVSYSTDFLIDNIQKAIDSEMPVIVKVDCYEEDIRKELYHKEHLDHSLLIYGYDDAGEQFYVIEQSKKNVLNYSQVVISYESLKNAVDGYNRYYHPHNMEEPLLISFEFGSYVKMSSADRSPYKNYRINYLCSLDLMLRQATPLQLIVNELIKYLSGNKDIEDSIDSIIEELNEIVNARTIEKYKVEHFLGNEPLTALANKILNNWLSIRLALLNYKFQGNNIKEKFDKSIIRLRENQILEQRLNFSVFILLSKNYDLADYD